ncbi:MAG: hypothetical protein ACR2P8_07255, partial [Myxococcota bacterium]
RSRPPEPGCRRIPHPGRDGRAQARGAGREHARRGGRQHHLGDLAERVPPLADANITWVND